MGVQKLTWFMRDDDANQIAEHVTLNSGNRMVVIIDAASFTGAAVTAVRLQAGKNDAFWKFGESHQRIAAEINRRLDALMKCADEIIIVKDGLAPMGKSDELESRSQRRCNDATLLYSVLCDGPKERLASMHPAGHIEREIHKRGEMCGDRDKHPQRYDPVSGRTPCRCQGSWCPGELCDLRASVPRTSAVYDTYAYDNRRARKSDPDITQVTLVKSITEGDDECARIANDIANDKEYEGKEPLILSTDSDFAIFDTPHGYLDLNTAKFDDVAGSVEGTMCAPHRLANRLESLLQGLPGAAGIKFGKEHLPKFAVLMGNDETKCLFEDKRGILNAVTTPLLKEWRQQFPCLRCFSRRHCDGRCGRKHLVTKGDINGHHVLRHWYTWYTRKHSRGRLREATMLSGLTLQIAVCAKFAADGSYDRWILSQDERTQEQCAAGLFAYDICDKAFDDRKIPMKRAAESHGPVVYKHYNDRHKDCRPNAADTCMLWLRAVRVDPPECDESSSPNIFKPCETLMYTKKQLKFFWLATEDVQRWDPALRRPEDQVYGTVDKHEIHVKLVGAINRTVCVRPFGPVLPNLSPTQMEERPWVQHLDNAAIDKIILSACGMDPGELQRDFAEKVRQWSASDASRRVFEKSYPPDPPEIEAIALWSLAQAVKDITDRELKAFATVVVCGSEEGVLRSRLQSDSDPRRFTHSCWREECGPCAPPECCVDVDKCCTKEYRRRTYLIAQWKVICSEISGLNDVFGMYSPEEPFRSGSGIIRRDPLMLHALLECPDFLEGECRDHRDLIEGLLELARGPSQDTAGEHTEEAAINENPVDPPGESTSKSNVIGDAGEHTEDAAINENPVDPPGESTTEMNVIDDEIIVITRKISGLWDPERIPSASTVDGSDSEYDSHRPSEDEFSDEPSNEDTAWIEQQADREHEYERRQERLHQDGVRNAASKRDS